MVAFAYLSTYPVSGITERGMGGPIILSGYETFWIPQNTLANH